MFDLQGRILSLLMFGPDLDVTMAIRFALLGSLRRANHLDQALAQLTPHRQNSTSFRNPIDRQTPPFKHDAYIYEYNIFIK